MKKSQILVGKIYIGKISGKIVPILVNEIQDAGTKTYRSQFDGQLVRVKVPTRFFCKNLKTGREIVVKSAIKFIREISAEECLRFAN